MVIVIALLATLRCQYPLPWVGGARAAGRSPRRPWGAIRLRGYIPDFLTPPPSRLATSTRARPRALTPSARCPGFLFLEAQAAGILRRPTAPARARRARDPLATLWPARRTTRPRGGAAGETSLRSPPDGGRAGDLFSDLHRPVLGASVSGPGPCSVDEVARPARLRLVPSPFAWQNPALITTRPGTNVIYPPARPSLEPGSAASPALARARPARVRACRGARRAVSTTDLAHGSSHPAGFPGAVVASRGRPVTGARRGRSVHYLRRTGQLV